MAAHKMTPSKMAAEIRNLLKSGGSSEHAAGAQRFFKEEIKSHGWATQDLRRSATTLRRKIRNEFGLEFLVQVADRLFTGRVLEEKIYAVFLLEKITHELADAEFELFESWLSRISSWADHDATRPLSDRSDDRCETRAQPESFPLGEVRESLASPRRLRCFDSCDAQENRFRSSCTSEQSSS